MMLLNDRVPTPPYRKTPVGVVTAGVTWSVRSKPLSSIDFTPDVAMSWLKQISPLLGSSRTASVEDVRGLVRRDHVARHIGRFQARADELDRVDVVIERTVVGRRVGDDHIARPVHRDGPLVARPIGAGDDLAFVDKAGAIGIVGVDGFRRQVDLALVW